MSKSFKAIKLKPCPFRVHGERISSLTVQGEFFYNEIFMPCMGEECACYYDSGDEIRCCRDNTYFILAERRQNDSNY